MPTSLINIGATPNDGTGNPIRTAFGIVNENFDIINAALFAGTESSIISAVSLTGGSILSNTWVNADVIVGNTIQSKEAIINGNVTIIGNLNVIGSQIASQSQQSSAPILDLHFSANGYVSNDNKDIGIKWQYYINSNAQAFLGWKNSTRSLVYMDNVTESANVITSGSFGNVHFGELLLSNTTAATSNTSGALKVSGGISTQGNLYVAGNVVSTFVNVTGNLVLPQDPYTPGRNVLGNIKLGGSDNIYINGQPVAVGTAGFNGGTVGLPTLFDDGTQSTSATTGAVRVTGGLGVGGNIYTNSNVVLQNPAREFIGNIRGNVTRAAQPFITSVGTLTSLTVAGQIAGQNIVPVTNNTYSLGSSGTTRWLKVWAFDADYSGAVGITGQLTTSTIVGSGDISTTSNTQSTSTTTGALKINGGMSIATGNLYIGGSGGRSIVATGTMSIVGNGTAITHTGDILPSANLSFNLGSATAWYNTFYGVSTQAKYADLAEIYRADAEYEPGTVVIFGGTEEITVTSDHADHRIAGVISTNPAYLMNATAAGLPVALRGRVPVKVSGPVNKGDLLVTSTIPGMATSVGGDTSFGLRVFAKSLETNPSNGMKIIEAVII